MSNASIILHLTTADEPTFEDVELGPEQHYVRVVNKIDTCAKDKRYDSDVIPISAQRGMGLDMLRQHLRALVDTSSLNAGSVVVTNMRHYAALKSAHEALGDALQAVDNNLSGDLISEDIRRILHHLGEITGEITSDDILHTIFSHFCIGK